MFLEKAMLTLYGKNYGKLGEAKHKVEFILGLGERLKVRRVEF